MGAIFVSDTVNIPKTMVMRYLEKMVLDSYLSRTTDDDIYRGDFGSTQSYVYRGKYKGKSENPIKKNINKFFEENDNFEKYVIDYAEVGQLGYVAVGFELEVLSGLRGSYNFNGQSYKNITELKKSFKNIRNKESLYGETIHFTPPGKLQVAEVGRVKMFTKLYKTKPKKLPSKYDHLTEYITVSYGAYNPY